MKTNDIDFSNDGTLMLTCGDDRTFKVWNIGTTTPLMIANVSTGDNLMVCKFLSTNLVLTTNSNNNNHKVYSSNFTNTVIRTYNSPTGDKMSSAGFFYCENSTRVVMGSDDGRFYWYNGTSTASTISVSQLFDAGGGTVWLAQVDRTNQFIAYGG
jgi:WD40 repeat protein